MLTRKSPAHVQLTGRWEVDGPKVMEALRLFHEYLNQPGALQISQADINSTSIGRDAASTGAFTELSASGLITATGGQIKFPATQNASSDANTLDDYEEGDWTPAISFVTPGDLAVAYSFQLGDYTKVGRMVFCTFNVLTSSFTHTTAAGAVQISGLPFMATSTANYTAAGNCFWQGVTKAGYTDLAPSISSGTQVIGIIMSASGSAPAQIGAADMPTGGTVRFRGSIAYRV